MMKTQPLHRLLVATLALTAASLIPQQTKAQFTTGNIVVLQVGDGSAALTNASTAVFLKEYNTITATQATSVSSVAIPTTGSARLVTSGSATSEGIITLSSDSTKIVIAGYDTTTAIASIASSTAANIARAIDTVSILGIPGKADTTKTAFSGNNVRSATRNNGENYWAAGGTTGTYYMGNLATPAVVQTLATNTRYVIAANGNLYFCTSSFTPGIGIYKIAGQPTVATTPTVLVPIGTGGSPYAFAINATETIAYVADDRTTVGGGIEKWVNTGGVWANTYTFSLGATSANGARGIAVDWSGANPVIYATSAEATANRLVKITDSNSTAAVVLLATAAANTAFRSVAFTPKAICINPVLTTTITNRTCTANGSVALNVTGGTTPSTFAWTGPGTFTASTQNIANLQAGTYNVTATTPGGCAATATAIITNPTFTASANAAGGITSVCQNDTVTLNANIGTGFTYQWNNIGGAIAGATNATYKTGTAGSYTVTVSSGTNCTATSTPAIAVTIRPLPVATITAGGSTTFCTGGSVQLCAPVTTPINTLAYVWTLNGVNITPAQTGQCYTSTTTGTYCVKVTDGTTGCTNTACTPVTVGAPPAAIISPSGTQAICAGSTLTLHTNNATGLTYQWKNNGTNVATGGTDSTYVVSAAGSYTVVVSAGAACSSTAIAVVVSVNPLPATAITPISASSICAGDTVRLKTVSTTGATYSWSVNGISIPAQADSLLTIPAANPLTTPITVGIRAIVTSASGCTDSSAAQPVVINPLPVPVATYSAGTLTTGSFNTYQWYLNGVAVTGATGQSFTPMHDGAYTVLVTNSTGCIAMSAVIMVNDLAVTGFQAAGISIYPNPAQHVVYVKAPFAVNITVKDLQGRTLRNVKNVTQVDIATLAAGIYSINVYKNDGELLLTQKLVKAQ